MLEMKKFLLQSKHINWDGTDDVCPLAYNTLTQQSLCDKSIADSVEALIGAHLLQLGPTCALKFMKWLGLKVLTSPVEIESPLLKFLDTSEQVYLFVSMLSSIYVLLCKFFIMIPFSQICPLRF